MADAPKNEPQPGATRAGQAIVGTPQVGARPLADGSISISQSTTAPTSAGELSDRTSEYPSPPAQFQGRYTLKTLLGQGGFGCVYSAWDELLHRVVAVKFARKERFSGTAGQVQFLDEARAAAKLKHPHIVTVFDSGTDAEGNPFVVFEFVDGESLSARMARQPLNREEIVLVMSAVAEAIQAAHKAGLVHRDLKPGNILIDRTGHPYVTDFGLAVDEQSQRKQAGAVAGTWSYMSPEQFRGETQYLDGRTDIWGLGVILYELLARRRPFFGRDVTELQDEVLNREPKPPRQYDETIPLELEQICLRCLAKSVTNRYSSAADLAQALRKCQRGVGSHSRRGWLWAIGGAAAVAGVALILGMAALGGRPEANRENPLLATPLVATDRSTVDPPKDTAALVTTQPLPVPLPGKWFSLLQRPPPAILWPVDSRNSRWDHHPEEQELWVSCAGRGLIKLGEVAKGDYDLQLNLFQSPWVGHVGLFFGCHNVALDGVVCRRLQLLELHCELDQGRQKATLMRKLMVLDEQSNQRISQTIAGAELPEIALRDQVLRISVEHGRLKAVAWNDAPLYALTNPEINDLVKAEDGWGEIGAYAHSAAGVFRRPELLSAKKAGNDQTR